MIEKKFLRLKKDELEAKEFVRAELGRGKISEIAIERTPVGEKIIVKTSKPGLIIGRRGEKIADLTEKLKKQFNMENPHIEIAEIASPDLDSQCVAEEMSNSLERFGPSSFKIVAYKMLQRIKNAGAMGGEIRLSGKLPSERAKSWRFAFGYLKKTGEQVRRVSKARTVAQTIPGTIGIKVEIVPPNSFSEEKITIDKNKLMKIEEQPEAKEEAKEEKAETKPKRRKSKKE